MDSGRTGRGGGRGRKAGHALKFHNFYVANDRLCQSSSTRRGQRTLTHCLREEHGTKQITVSHWTTSPQDHAAKQDQSTQTKAANHIKTGSTCEGIKIPPDHQFGSGQREQQQQSILQSLLANNLLSEANQSAGPGPQSHVPGSGKANKKRNKRKPLVVRRLLPGQSALPLTSSNPPYSHPSHPFAAGGSAPQDQPLDLTTAANRSRESECEGRDPVQHLIRSVQQSAAQAASIIASVRGADPVRADPRDRTRGANQRSVIKQKLEDAFRDNGFLVKTKQVSDGEATFCKFRQLRKYTRYYLKSWHKHLPDEVNKLYKGFLPPVSDKGKK